MKHLLSILMLICLLALSACSIDEEKVLTAPTVKVTSQPFVGDTLTDFEAIAYDLADGDQQEESLRVRFNFGETNKWTNYTTERSATYRYKSGGTYTITCQVMDNDGWTGENDFVVEVNHSGNKPPNKTKYPVPGVNSLNIDINTDLFWQCTDPEEDPLRFDVYLSVDPENLILYQANISSCSYYPGPLQYGTVYFWRVDAKDSHGNKTVGNLWTFTTSDQ